MDWMPRFDTSARRRGAVQVSTLRILVKILAFPPVVWSKTTPQAKHLTSVVAQPKTICSFPHSKHLTFRKRERGTGMSL